MWFWKYTFSSVLGISALAGGVYLVHSEEPKHEWVKLLTDTVSHRTENIISPFWDTKIYWTPSESVPQNSLSDHKNSLDELLQKNPTLKQRIQWMAWYRDYISGRLDKNTAEKYILDAFSIEDTFQKNPWFLDKIQYENWWQRYARWETNPSDMLAGNISAYFQMQKIQNENPEMYQKAQMSPLWSAWIQYWEDYTVVWQREILTSITLRFKFLDENPDIEKKLEEKGFTRNNLFTDDWSKWEWVYGFLNEIEDMEK